MLEASHSPQWGKYRTLGADQYRIFWYCPTPRMIRFDSDDIRTYMESSKVMPASIAREVGTTKLPTLRLKVQPPEESGLRKLFREHGLTPQSTPPQRKK